jgi:RHS repeat-associated protein
MGVEKPVGFSTGREFDKETGLYYYRARYYDPMEGRFITKDPIGFIGGINLYIYVQNNPVNIIDPLGLQGFDPGQNPPTPPGDRDTRTPWLPPNLPQRSQDCPPYFMDSGKDELGQGQVSIWKGVIPLVKEKKETISKCKVRITCYYSGKIGLGANWGNTEFSYAQTSNNLVFIKNDENCCKQ